MKFPITTFKFTVPRLYLGDTVNSDFGDEPYRLFGIEADTKFKITKQDGILVIDVQILGFGFVFSRQTSY